MNEFLENPNVDKIFKTIADALGTTVDMVRENALDYILEFGRYSYVNKITFIICLSVVVGVIVIGLIVSLVYSFRFDLNCYESKGESIIAAKKVTKYAFKLSSAIWVGMTFVFVLCETMLYLSSPTMYSTTRLLELIRGY